jgi:histidinol-phosphate aminotransferase
MIPLDKNESYWLLDDTLVIAFTAHDQKELSTYPDYTQLKKELAEYVGVTTEQICLTPGSDAAIQILAEAYLRGGGEAVLPVPTFYGYESILDRVGATTTPVYYTESEKKFEFPIKETLSAIGKDSVKALFLCQPNNPLGCNIPDEEMNQLINSLKNSDKLMISDEAYFEFSGKTLLPYLDEMQNLVIIRTLSKGFGLSGARVGYCVAAPQIIQRMEKLMLPWSLSHATLYAARAALSHKESVQQRLNLVVEQREMFIAALSKIPTLAVYPTETNFVLIRVPDAAKLAEALLEKGIKVALGERMSKFPEAKSLLHSTLRIAIPSPEDIHSVLDSISQVMV